MTDLEWVLVEVERGLESPLPLLAWADLLEEAGDPRAAGLRRIVREGREPLNLLYIFAAAWPGGRDGWGWRTGSDGFPWRLPPAVYEALGWPPAVRAEWKVWPTRVAAYLALADVFVVLDRRAGALGTMAEVGWLVRR